MATFVVTLAVALVALLIFWLTPWPRERGGLPARPPIRIADVVAEFTGSLAPDGRYRIPTVQEQRIAALGIGLLLDDNSQQIPRATRWLAKLGFSGSHGIDDATGRPYALIVNEPHSERAWGLYLVDLSAPVRLAIEVPHPNSDLRTEEMGLSLFRRVPGSVLLIAGAHRTSARKAADVAHREDSIFNAVAGAFAQRALPQVQLHGFHDRSLPGKDVVLSPGAADDSALAERTIRRLMDAGFSVCPATRQPCGRLAGTQNTQSQTAAELSSLYLHVEVSRSVREDDSRREALVGAMAAAIVP